MKTNSEKMRGKDYSLEMYEGHDGGKYALAKTDDGSCTLIADVTADVSGQSPLEYLFGLYGNEEWDNWYIPADVDMDTLDKLVATTVVSGD